MIKDILESALQEKIVGTVYSTGKIETESGKEYFLKYGSKSRTYQCEASGLAEIAKANVITTPEVMSFGDQYILTEYINSNTPSSDFFSNFGKRLAKLHQYKGKSFGFYEDNYIGTNPQINIPAQDEKNDWITFYFNKRLLYQYKLASQNGYITNTLKNGFIKLESNLYKILGSSTESPSLLHGDLWSGNYICNNDNRPVLIDPAVYYGHREADIAMTKVFGGFPQSFYSAYMEEYPLKEGWEYRENIYKLYHILNHLNLFGIGYLPEAEYILKFYS